MEIVHVAAELAPFAKVGGLGDVLYGLSHAQAKHNDNVEIIMPKYKFLDLHLIEPCEVIIHDLYVPFGGKKNHTLVWQGKINGVLVTLIDSQDEKGYFQREHIYGYHDDNARFIYFCKAVVELFKRRDQKPDVVHVHDWQTSLIPLLLKKEKIKAAKVLTIHNLAYRGICDPPTFELSGLQSKDYLSIDQLLDEDYAGNVNLLKGGIVFSDAITTVSPTYAQEILTPEHGGSMHRILKVHEKKLKGILNGIDFHFWNPHTDPYIPYHFSIHDVRHIPPFIRNKAKNKSYLRKLLSMEDNPSMPLVTAVTRLVYQKGPKLISHAIEHTLKMGGQFVLVGTPGEPEMEKVFYALKRDLSSSRQVHIELSYNESLAHHVFAAADLLIVPSFFEPCGLTQMIGMRYGTIPVVRETGGLVDTVFDIENSPKSEKERNGFTFSPKTPAAIEETLNRSFAIFREHPEKWHRMVDVGMRSDFSWDRPAKAYREVYENVVAANGALKF